jgi:hypothetical protein
VDYCCKFAGLIFLTAQYGSGKNNSACHSERSHAAVLDWFWQ